MMDLADARALPAYLALAAVVTLTPGPNMTLVITTALELGLGAAIRTTLGVGTGLALWAAASAAGVAAVLATSPVAFSGLQAAGGMWLVYLGIRGWLRSREATGGRAISVTRRHAYVAGLVTNLLNPFVGAFYFAALPGFVRAGQSAPLTSLLLAAMHITMVMLWLSLCSVLIARGNRVLGGSSVRQLLAGAAAVVLVGFGLRVLATVVDSAV